MQKFDRDTALPFLVLSMSLADKHAVNIATKDLGELEILVNLGATAGRVLDAHSAGDSVEFRKTLANLIALAVIAEQFTQPECDCADCLEKRHIAEQQQAEARNSKFYFSVYTVNGEKLLRVTAAPEKYTGVPAINWQSLTAPDLPTAEKNAKILAQAMGML